MTQPFDHSRFDWNVDQADTVLSSSGTQRPKLPRPVKRVVIHYVGAGRSWLDAGDTAQEIMSIERYARGAKKPNEYNVVVDAQAETWEYAGDRQSAHNGTEGVNGTFVNGDSISILALYGLEVLDEAGANGLITGIRRALGQAIAGGILSPNYEIRGHTQVRPGGTPCPGPLWQNKSWWNRITAPLVFTLPTTPPPAPEVPVSVLTPKLGTLTLAPGRITDTRGSAKVKGVKKFSGGIGGSPGAVSAIFTALQAEGSGYITCNGITVLAFDSGSRLMNTVTIPLDGKGMFEIEVHGSAAHLVIDRVGFFTFA